jgi:pimeloyl-ACP methyl ester carboxylesterase
MIEREIALDDGARTTLQIWGERGPIVLCIHGMTSSRRSWQRLAKRLEGTYRVAAYDQRGHGDSASVTGPMALDRGVLDFLDVEAALGEPIAALVGHSWGGAVAIRGGHLSPVPRVAAIDPMIRQAPDVWYDEFLDELGKSFALTGADRERKTREEFAAWSLDDVDGKVHALQTMTVAPIQGLRSENDPADWDLREEIATYDRPLLLALPGREEGFNDAETIDDVFAHHAALVKIVTFPGQGHNLHRTDFDAFARELEAFLA